MIKLNNNTARQSIYIPRQTKVSGTAPLDNYATVDYVDSEIARVEAEIPSSEDFATTDYVDSEIARVEAEIPSIEGLAEKAYVDDEIDAVREDISDLEQNIPTKVSDLSNDSGFITATVENLTNYYKNTETYTKSEINTLIAAIPHFQITVVDELPATGASATVYLVRNDESTGTDLYDEWIYVDNRWEHLGTARVDMSQYYTKTETDALINTETARTESTYAKIQSLGNYYTSAQTDTQISNAVSGKQETLISGTNIKTINEQSILGSGDITIEGGGEEVIELTQAEYDAIVPPYPENTTYIITDSPAVDMDDFQKVEDMDAYYTKDETNEILTGKADAVSVTPYTSGYNFPTWNEQGIITGRYSYIYQAQFKINNNNRNIYSNASGALSDIYAPTTAGNSGQILTSNGSGNAPTWMDHIKSVRITQDEYDELTTKDNNTLYLIVD